MWRDFVLLINSFQILLLSLCFKKAVTSIILLSINLMLMPTTISSTLDKYSVRMAQVNSLLSLDGVELVFLVKILSWCMEINKLPSMISTRRKMIKSEVDTQKFLLSMVKMMMTSLNLKLRLLQQRRKIVPLVPLFKLLSMISLIWKWLKIPLKKLVMTQRRCPWVNLMTEPLNKLILSLKIF